MPTYDYKCKACETVFSISGPYSTLFGYKPTCPRCRTENIQKLIGNISVIYKANGFYNTDKNKENKKETENLED